MLAQRLSSVGVATRRLAKRAAPLRVLPTRAHANAPALLCAFAPAQQSQRSLVTAATAVVARAGSASGSSAGAGAGAALRGAAMQSAAAYSTAAAATAAAATTTMSAVRLPGAARAGTRVNSRGVQFTDTALRYLSTSTVTHSARHIASAAATAAAARPSLAQELWAVLSSRLPKGFGSFFPKRAEADAEKETDKEKEKEKEKEKDDAEPKKDAEKESESEKEKDSDKEKEKEKGDKEKGDKKGDKKGDGKSGAPSPMSAFLILTAVLMLVAAAIPSNAVMPRGEEVSFQQFLSQYLAANKVEKIVILNGSVATVYLKDVPGVPSLYFNIGTVDSFERKLQVAQEAMDLDPRDWVPVTYSTRVNVIVEVLKALPTILLLGLTFYFFRNMMGELGGMAGTKRGGKNIFSFGKSPATIIKPGEKTKVTFKDVAGLDEAKVEVMEFVKFLKNPAKFTKLGAKIPKGALLVGPPGTGKTLLAKACAGEASVPFYSISGSDFIEMFVGVGPSRVRDLFAEARKSAPCIVFIDEIDAVGRSRSKGGFSGGNDERENTLNQLLVEMDGFNSDTGVVVLAGTNRADILDKALLRPGRFDRHINIDKPDIKGRKQIFLVHLKSLKLGHPIDDLAGRLAALTPGFAGADIANVCNEAALIAARADKKTVELVDFEAACDRVIGGLEKKNSVMSAAERRLVAFHEAGHAVVGWFLEHAHPVLKVTIVPRGKGALGFAQYLPSELALYQQKQLTDMMCMTLGGRAAEQEFFGAVSTGAADDLKKVTKLAYAQVANFGMSDKIGNVSYQPDESDSQFTKPFSESTAQMIDAEVGALVRAAYERTRELVKQHKTQIETLALRLLKDETINHDVIVEVLGRRQWTTPAYSDYVANASHDQQVANNKAAAAAAPAASDSSAAAATDKPTASEKPAVATSA